MAYSAGITMPRRTSRSSVTSGSVPPPNWLSFSTPMTSTTSRSPRPTARNAWCSAVAPPEQALSTLVTGTPPMSSAARMRCPVSIPPKLCPQNTSCTSPRSSPAARSASRTVPAASPA